MSIEDFVLEKNKNYNGLFRISNSDIEKIEFKGILYIDRKNKVFLEIRDSNIASLINEYLTNNFFEQFNITGVINNQIELSLFDCYMPKRNELKLRVNDIIVGKRTNTLNDKNISCIYIQFSEYLYVNKNKLFVLNDDYSFEESFNEKTFLDYESLCDKATNIRYFISLLAGKLIDIETIGYKDAQNNFVKVYPRFVTNEQRGPFFDSILLDENSFFQALKRWQNSFRNDDFAMSLYFTTLLNSKNLYEQFFLDYLIRSFEGIHKVITANDNECLGDRILNIYNLHKDCIPINKKIFIDIDTFKVRIVKFRNLYAHCKIEKLPEEKKIPYGSFFEYSMLMNNIIRVFLIKDVLKLNVDVPILEIK